jgi:hypothetical protein
MRDPVQIAVWDRRGSKVGEAGSVRQVSVAGSNAQLTSVF